MMSKNKLFWSSFQYEKSTILLDNHSTDTYLLEKKIEIVNKMKGTSSLELLFETHVTHESDFCLCN